MVRFINSLLVGFAILSLFFFPPKTNKTREYFAIAEENINIMKQPSEESDAIYYLNKGDKITVSAEASTFYYIRKYNDQRWLNIKYKKFNGYVDSRYISIGKPTFKYWFRKNTSWIFSVMLSLWFILLPFIYCKLEEVFLFTKYEFLFNLNVFLVIYLGVPVIMFFLILNSVKLLAPFLIYSSICIIGGLSGAVTDTKKDDLSDKDSLKRQQENISQIEITKQSEAVKKTITYTDFDEYGHRIGKSEYDPDKQITKHFNTYGTFVGTSKHGWFSTDHYDTFGYRTGYTNSVGIIYDKYDNVIGSRTKSGDKTTHYNILGEKIGTTEEGDKTGTCFITTAVFKTLGKNDNCAELTSFRVFRDTFMQETSDRRTEIQEYYDIAPKICFEIDKLGEKMASKKYISIWKTNLKPAYEAIKSGDNNKAYNIYKHMVLNLKTQYL